MTGKEPERTCQANRRRYQRGMLSLRKPDNIFDYRNDPKRAEELKKTLATVYESGTWLIEHEESIEEFLQSTTRRSTSASSSSHQPMLSTGTAAEPAKGSTCGSSATRDTWLKACLRSSSNKQHAERLRGGQRVCTPETQSGHRVRIEVPRVRGT